VLSAYASDGGLYVPDHLPSLPENYRSLWKELSFPDVCAEVFHLFCDIDVAVLRGLCAESYKDFNDGVTHLPLHRFDDLYLLDTSLGPTLAFKDVGQQIMGKLINYLLAQRGERGNIVVETSGDTGPAAIAGVRGSSHVNIFCLYPHGRVSEVQELQMVTVDAPNVFVYRTEGNTDEQASVLKEIFDDHAFLQRHHIFSVNSINIGRIIAQSSYFIWASLQFPEATELTVVIPTGAFGNAMGAYFARLMGAPLGRIVCATNANDIVHRTIAYGDLRLDENRQVWPPPSPVTPLTTHRTVAVVANPSTPLPLPSPLLSAT
jgi:threonine synthase